MKKILLAFDGSLYSQAALNFARTLNDVEPVLLDGLFLPQLNLAVLATYAGQPTGMVVPLAEDEDSITVKENIRHFETFCQHNNIDYRVHNFTAPPLPLLRKETRYADLLILGSDIFYNNANGETLDQHWSDILHDAECPVLIVPETFDLPAANIVAFDGSASAAFAMKQFAYLFPQLCNNKTLLVYANENEGDFPDAIYVEEFAARHFTHPELCHLRLNPEKYFSTWLSEEEGAILISGAFGRSVLSSLFKHSFVTELINENKIPVFIAHKK
jgi:nucleotide-binding universal stress UspA family protein